VSNLAENTGLQRVCRELDGLLLQNGLLPIFRNFVASLMDLLLQKFMLPI
jgi:hypothetical protein